MDEETLQTSLAEYKGQVCCRLINLSNTENYFGVKPVNTAVRNYRNNAAYRNKLFVDIY